MEQTTATSMNSDAIAQAIGNLAFLLSVIRCGERLDDDEESNVRGVIESLRMQDAQIAQLTQDRDRLAGEVSRLQRKLSDVLQLSGCDVDSDALEYLDELRQKAERAETAAEKPNDRSRPRLEPMFKPEVIRRGHEFTPENTIRKPEGRKTCRICRNARCRRRRAELKAARAEKGDGE